MAIGIILAGGSGTRMSLNKPKQFADINGKPLIIYTLEVFEASESISSIIIVCKDGWESYLREIASSFKIEKMRWVVEGGKTHQESLTNALSFLKNINLSSDEIVVIHNANRPMVDVNIIEDSINLCNQKGNGISAIQCVDSMMMKENEDDNFSNQFLKRENIIRAQSPQAYKFQLIYEIYMNAKKYGLKDRYECELMSYYGKKIYFSKGSKRNLKITTDEDIPLFKAFLADRESRELDVKRKKVQKINLEILKVIMEICDKHNLTCYLAYGTLLGAVRHKGFIPWDDDVDLMIHQDEYVLLEKYLQSELPDGYFLQTYKTDRYYGLNWMKVRKNGTTCVDERWNGIQCHGGISVDIFQISRVPDNAMIYKIWRLLYRIQHAILETFIIDGKHTEIDKKNKKILYMIALNLPYRVRFTLVELLNNLIFGIGRAKTKKSIAGAMKEMYPTNIFNGVKKVQFEDGVYNAPYGYDEFLKLRYGNYMDFPDVENRKGHNYQCIDFKNEIYSSMNPNN